MLRGLELTYFYERHSLATIYHCILQQYYKWCPSGLPLGSWNWPRNRTNGTRIREVWRLQPIQSYWTTSPEWSHFWTRRLKTSKTAKIRLFDPPEWGKKLSNQQNRGPNSTSRKEKRKWIWIIHWNSHYYDISNHSSFCDDFKYDISFQDRALFFSLRWFLRWFSNIRVLEGCKLIWCNSEIW